MDRHPLSAAWPVLGGDDFTALEDDIKANGIHHPIVTLEGQILDGWHRYRIARSNAIEYKTTEYTGGDPAGYVISCNNHRRHLTATQRAAAVLKVREWRPHGGSGQELTVSSSTNRDMAKEAGVSVATMRVTRKRVEEGHGDALAAGTTTLRSLDKQEAMARPLTRMEKLQAAVKERDARIAMLESENEAMRQQLDVTDATPESLAAENEVLRSQLDKCRAERDDYRDKCAWMAKQLNS